ncbi:MAG: SDR family oxidoreductase, partial [Bacteroidales bacterium]
SGIGEQCAISCSEMGANVILIARNKELLNEVSDKLHGNNHAVFSFDLQEFNDYPNLVNDIVGKFGKIYGFIHSAGKEASIPINALRPKIFQDVFSLNTISFFEMVRLISKNSNVESSASYIAISSVMGFLGQPGKLSYCSSKAALINGVKALSLELAPKKIRVNCISPGIVETPMVKDLFEKISPENQIAIRKAHPLGFGQTIDVANACIFLLSNASKWITGTNLVLDGGYSSQ